MGRSSNRSFIRVLLGVAVACLAAGAAARAEGTLRGVPYVIDSSSRIPKVVSSPAFAGDGTMYVSALYKSGSDGGGVYAFTSTSSGLQLKPGWPHRFSDTVEASPTIADDGTIYVGVDDGHIYALDGVTGAQKGSAFDANPLSPTGVTLIESTAAFSPDHQTLYVGLEFFDGLTPVGGGLLALTTSLEKRWFIPFDGMVSSSPAVAGDGTIYVAAWDGKLYSVSPSQTVNWSHDMGAGQHMDASPAIGRDGTIYIGNLTQFIALTPDNRVKWQRLDVVTQVTAAVSADDTVYVADYLNFSLDALRGRSGELKWKYGPRGQPSFSAPLIRADGTVIYAGFDNVVRCIDVGGTIHGKDPGVILWETPAGNRSPFDGSPAISPVDNSIWIGAINGNIYGINGDYPLSRYASWPMFQHDARHTGDAPLAAGGGRLINLSSRAIAGDGYQFIAGLYVAGLGPKTVLLRAVGPTLGVFQIANALADPDLSIHFSASAQPTPNDNWEQSDEPDLTRSVTAAVGAFPLPPGSKDAAIVTQVDPKLAAEGSGLYSMVVGAPHGGSGVALAEVYDAEPLDAPRRLVNLSTRGFVGTGERVLIAGFQIRNGSLPLLIRAVGPALANFQVPDTLQRPKVKVQDRSGRVIASNTGWGDTSSPDYSPLDLQFVSTAVGAFGLPAGSSDAALIVSLQPDQLYTITVTGVGDTTGNAIVEIYDASFQ